jgi:peptidoglycan/LPS O-acetylase OafA/YrhL
LIAYTVIMLGATVLLHHRPDQPPHADLPAYLKSLPFALLYGINYVTGEAPMALRHLWSVACEMQFYFLAPIIYWAGGRTGARRDVVFGSVLLLLTGLGMLQPFIGRWRPNYWQYNFEFAVWPMMLGFFCEYRRAWFSRLPETAGKFILWLSLVICAASGCLMLIGHEMKLLVVAAGALLLAPCLLAYLHGRPVPGMAGEGLRWCGERTYSIYLWQQPFTICRFLPVYLHPFGSLASMAVGALWFRLFEFPFLSASRQRQEKSR